MAEEFVNKPMESARERIIMAAWELFHEQGMDGTSIDEILAASDTGKSQFYHYFGSKEGLIHAVMDEAYSLVKEGNIEGIQKIEGWEGLRDFLTGCIEKMEHYDCTRTCPLGRFVADMRNDDEVLRRGMLLVFEAKKSFLKEFFIAEKAKGVMREDVDIDALVTFCESVIQGASIITKLERDIKPLKDATNTLFKYLEAQKI